MIFLDKVVIWRVIYNWYVTSSKEENYSSVTVGFNGVTEIKYIEDYYAAHYEDGKILCIYNPNTVEIKPVDSSEKQKPTNVSEKQNTPYWCFCPKPEIQENDICKICGYHSPPF